MIWKREFNLKGSEGIDVGMLKMFFILYADNMFRFSDSAAELQKNWTYCTNTAKETVWQLIQIKQK